MLSAKKRYKHIELISSLNNRFKGLLVAKESSGAGFLALLECHSFREILTARDTELDKPQVSVGTKLNYIELLKNCFAQRKTSLVKTKAAPETRL